MSSVSGTPLSSVGEMDNLYLSYREQGAKEKLFAAPRAFDLWFAKHQTEHDKSGAPFNRDQQSEFWSTHVTAAVVNEFRALLRRVTILRASNASIDVCGNDGFVLKKLLCSIGPVSETKELSYSLDYVDAYAAVRANVPLVVEFQHEAASTRSGSAFVTLRFHDKDRQEKTVLDYWISPSGDTMRPPLDTENLAALCSALGIVHAAPLQVVCFFSVLASAAMPWRTPSYASSDFGCGDGLWLFPGNLCFTLRQLENGGSAEENYEEQEEEEDEEDE